MSEIFVTSTGFLKKTLPTIISEYQALFQGIWGVDIDLDPQGVVGQEIAMLAKREADIWDGAEEIYNSRNPNSATGVSLDNIMIENGIERLGASYTVVKNVVLFGANSTIIPSGKLAKNPEQSVQYSLDSTVTIDKTSCHEALITLSSVSVGDHYIITINAVNYDYTAIGGDTIDSVLAALLALIELGTWGGSGSISSSILDLYYATSFSVDVNANLSFTDIGNFGNFTCTTKGSNTLPGSSLTEIVTPVSGWDSVYNPEVGIPGRSIESDPAARIRRTISVMNGSATDEAIKEAILNNVANVVGCTVASNRTNITDVESRPPHSFEVIVSGGTDADVAEMIYEKQGAGVESYGNTSVIITDPEGYQQTIKFSRAVDKYIWVRVSRAKYSEETYPTDGDDQIKAQIVSWSLDSSNISPGKDIIPQRLSIPVYQVQGIAKIKIECAKTDSPSGTPTYSEDVISLSAREIGVFATTRIIVQDLT